VAALRAAQLAGNHRAAAEQTARDYLAYADRAAGQFQRPACIVVRGTSGSGKSTLAAALAARIGGEHLATDAIRRQMFPDAAAAPPGQGRYTAADRRKVYHALLARAEEWLAAGIPVVLDGTFLLQQHRRAAAEVARRGAAASLVLTCVCPAEVAARRISARAAAGPSLSEATAEILDHQRREEEPDDPAAPSTPIDSTQPLEKQLQAAITALAAAL
jgi:predicted kinase